MSSIPELRSLGQCFSGSNLLMGEIDMINVLPPPTETEEYQNMAEILRELAAQVRFSKTRNELVNFADTFDRLAALAEHSSEATVQNIARLNR